MWRMGPSARVPGLEMIQEIRRVNDGPTVPDKSSKVKEGHRVTNCLTINVTGDEDVQGSLTHNSCYRERDLLQEP